VVQLLSQIISPFGMLTTTSIRSSRRLCSHHRTWCWKPGSWNDLTNTGDSSGNINPKDTSLNMAERMTILFKIAASTTITITNRFVIKMWYRYHSSSCRRRNNTLVRFCLRRNTPRDRKFFTTNITNTILC
jgi:hypothetical protein